MSKMFYLPIFSMHNSYFLPSTSDFKQKEMHCSICNDNQPSTQIPQVIVSYTDDRQIR